MKTEIEMYKEEVKMLKEKLISGYVDPKTEAAILRRIEMIEYKYLD